jgi:hypothetical protein
MFHLRSYIYWEKTHRGDCESKCYLSQPRSILVYLIWMIMYFERWVRTIFINSQDEWSMRRSIIH